MTFNLKLKIYDICTELVWSSYPNVFPRVHYWVFFLMHIILKRKTNHFFFILLNKKKSKKKHTHTHLYTFLLIKVIIYSVTNSSFFLLLGRWWSATKFSIFLEYVNRKLWKKQNEHSNTDPVIESIKYFILTAMILIQLFNYLLSSTFAILMRNIMSKWHFTKYKNLLVFHNFNARFQSNK